MSMDVEQNKLGYKEISIVCLAVDVYNDSLVETLSARSWSSRSLSSMYANNVLEKFEDKGRDTADTSFNSFTSMCHYRSPIIYAEMLEVIADVQRRLMSFMTASATLYKLMGAWISSGNTGKEVRNLVLKIFWIPCASALTTYLLMANQQILAVKCVVGATGAEIAEKAKNYVVCMSSV